MPNLVLPSYGCMFSFFSDDCGSIDNLISISALIRHHKCQFSCPVCVCQLNITDFNLNLNFPSGPKYYLSMESEDECEVEFEYEVATPRLQTPFYEALRKKYPKV